MSGTAQVGVTGLAVMGANLARNFASRGYGVALHNRTLAKATGLAESHRGAGSFVVGGTPREFVDALERPRRIVAMVPAGAATDAVIEEFAPLLEPGDAFVDGGNAWFEDTRRRQAALQDRGIHFIGAGISGGEEGALRGPSIMPGGSVEACAEMAPFFEAISARADGSPCTARIGPDGAGHFVKMVHNGIEYADMQLVAEAYDLLRQVAGHSAEETAAIFRAWNRGRLGSYLIEITSEVLSHTDARSERPFVDIVLDQAQQKGTGQWAVQSALNLGVPVSGFAEAVFARSLSGNKPQRTAGRQLPGPATTALGNRDADRLTERIEQALYAAKVLAYAQGWSLIQSASRAYDWNVDLAAVAGIWRGGCIIRAELLAGIRDAYTEDPQLPTLLADKRFAAELGAAQLDLRHVIINALRHGTPVPALSATLSYYDTLRAQHLPTALIQAQRDFFGAHTYRRTDVDGTYHTRWSEDRAEIRLDE